MDHSEGCIVIANRRASWPRDFARRVINATAATTRRDQHGSGGYPSDPCAIRADRKKPNDINMRHSLVGGGTAIDRSARPMFAAIARGGVWGVKSAAKSRPPKPPTRHSPKMFWPQEFRDDQAASATFDLLYRSRCLRQLGHALRPWSFRLLGRQRSLRYRGRLRYGRPLFLGRRRSSRLLKKEARRRWFGVIQSPR